ncbi:YbaY family lipoprotein [Leptolyngbya sp. CCNP1308]|uniref:YbaY family lipoprotein n=1 Tax=Leptolyngbya sp. CCNP1308 TaxID=3110255 RepID=UPI002B220337|nr:YbaY family lipoprotein [Leptolyngbya sp. CCNP1308]MEA5452852.1 YbaY family lipoprotein [Leptolyngbya sp. CCNP1308]
MNKRVFFTLLGAGLVAASLGSGVMAGGQAMAQTQPEWHNCMTREVFTPEKQAWCDRWDTLINGTYIVPLGFGPEPTFETITLENGEYNRPGELVVGMAKEPNWLAFGDINGDGKTDAAVFFGVNQGGGTNLITYVAAVMDVDGDAQALRPVAVGERIMLNGPTTIDNQRINVSQLTQTEVVNRSFVVDSDSLSELAQLPGPVRPSVPDGTIVFSQTSTYAVRVFTQQGQPRINLFNKTTGRQELNAAPATANVSAEGITFTHGGTPSVAVNIAANGAQTIEVNNAVQTNSASVTGTVSYLPRIAMPPNAILDVSLVDVSRADAPAVVLASQGVVFGDRQVPIPFELVYNPDQIDPRYSYAVQARIIVDGDLRFTTTSRFAVITQGNPTYVEVQVDPVSR